MNAKAFIDGGISGSAGTGNGVTYNYSIYIVDGTNTAVSGTTNNNLDVGISDDRCTFDQAISAVAQTQAAACSPAVTLSEIFFLADWHRVYV